MSNIYILHLKLLCLWQREFDLHLIISFEIRFGLCGWDNRDEAMENLNALKLALKHYDFKFNLIHLEQSWHGPFSSHG